MKVALFKVLQAICNNYISRKSISKTGVIDLHEKGRDPFMLVIPHPDDAEINAAGTVAGWTREGKEVFYVVTTNGDKGSSDPGVDPGELARTREKEQKEAAELVGVEKTVFLGYPDQGLEDTLEFRKELVRVIRAYRPLTVMTVDPFRRYPWHRDHRITGQVVLDAIYPFARDRLSYPELLAEGLEPHKVKEVLLWGSEDPNCCFDITHTLELKLEALRCHSSQLQNLDLHKMESWLRKRALKAAQNEEFQLGEDFHHIDIWW